ncbi:MAG: hypothetical protein ACP5NS_00100 [Candidatus Pacearchaeota archaeon]
MDELVKPQFGLFYCSRSKDLSEVVAKLVLDSRFSVVDISCIYRCDTCPHLLSAYVAPQTAIDASDNFLEFYDDSYLVEADNAVGFTRGLERLTGIDTSFLV